MGLLQASEPLILSPFDTSFPFVSLHHRMANPITALLLLGLSAWTDFGGGINEWAVLLRQDGSSV